MFYRIVTISYMQPLFSAFSLTNLRNVLYISTYSYFPLLFTQFFLSAVVMFCIRSSCSSYSWKPTFPILYLYILSMIKCYSIEKPFQDLADSGSSLWTLVCHFRAIVQSSGLLERALGLLEQQVSSSFLSKWKTAHSITQSEKWELESLAKSLQPKWLDCGMATLGIFCCLNNSWGLAHDQFGLRQLGSVRRQWKQ